MDTSPTLTNSSQDTSIHNENHHNPTILIIAIVVPITTIVALIILLKLFLKHKCRSNTIEDGHGVVNFKSTNSRNSISSLDSKSCISGIKQPKFKGAQVFTYKELELATGGFSKGNVIGCGGYGVVYRGTLLDGTMAAIKMLNREGKQGEREFRVEVDLLSQLHSSYLVRLLGYCADRHHRLLVFEFMPNGSLQQHLHHPNSADHQHQPLDWGVRLRMALDCARALEFLHECTVPAIIHRDFKCSNILLDKNYRARVSDFGMAKIGSDKIDGQVLTRVLGTRGYVAPEYALSGKLTTKSDVYSYGVVLLELLTGRMPVDMTKPPGSQSLVTWALPRLTNSQKVMEMVDPSLRGQCSKKELIQVAAIAAVCVQPESEYRPLMTDVVQSLIPLVRSQCGTCPTTPFRVQQQKGNTK